MLSVQKCIWNSQLFVQKALNSTEMEENSCVGDVEYYSLVAAMANECL